MTLEIKRVVTGVDAAGTSVFYEDATLPPTELAIMPGVKLYGVWGTEGPLASPVTDPSPDHATFFPGPGGTRFGLFTFPPEAPADPDAPMPDEETLAALVGEAEAKAPGLLGVFEPDAPGMHQTRTVDYAVVVEGELWLELDHGKEVRLPRGTCITQNGARHAWHNRGSEPATLAYVIVANP